MLGGITEGQSSEAGLECEGRPKPCENAEGAGEVKEPTMPAFADVAVVIGASAVPSRTASWIIAR